MRFRMRHSQWAVMALRWRQVAGWSDLPAMLIVCALTTLCYVGIRQSSVNSAIVILKVTILLVVITAGAFYVTAAYWHPFPAAQHRHLGPVRLEWCIARRCRGLLRVHRLRCGLDHLPGSTRSLRATVPHRHF